MQSQNQCDNCLKIFRCYAELERHMLALRQCKKTELDKNGNIIPNKDYKCDECEQLFSQRRSLIKHQKDYCKGKKPSIITTNSNNPITTTQSHNPTTTTQSYNTTTTTNDNSIINNITNNITHDNKININLDTVRQYIKPKNDFKIIPNNFINVNNVEKYIKLFFKQSDAPDVNITQLTNIIKSILVDMYINNINVSDRNIITMNSRKKLYYYENNDWTLDLDNDKFRNCIKDLLEQFMNAINDKIFIICKISARNKLFLLKFDSDDIELNEIVEYMLYKTKNEDLDALYDEKLKKRNDIYDSINKILLNSDIVNHILSSMKSRLYIDEDLQKIIRTIQLQSNIADE